MIVELEKNRIIVGYARVSSREQAVDSQALEQQIARLKAAGATEIFQDIQSGSKNNRPALKELMTSISEGKIHEVIITRIDRIARSLPKLRECIEIFANRRVDLRVLDQEIDFTTSQGKLMVNLLGSLAEWETDLLSERVRHGKQYRRNKQVANESYPWGYKIVNDKYHLNESPFLCLISNRPSTYLELYYETDLTKLNALTVKEIARDCIDIFFNVKGATRALKVIFQKYGLAKINYRRNGSDGKFHWTVTGFIWWLSNPVLCGHTAYLQRINLGKGKRKKNQRENWELVYNTHSEHKLITDEEALEIQRILKFNHKKGPITNPELNETNSYREYAYQSGLVFCAECGSKCITKSAKRKHGGMYYYFACRYTGMGCENITSTRKQNIEDALIRTLVQRSQTITSELEPSPLPPEKSEKLKELESRLDALEKIPGFDPDMENLKNKIRKQITEEINPFISDSIVDKSTEEIIRVGNNLAIWHTLCPDDKVKVFQQIVHKITVHNGKVKEVILKI
ncbi:fdxN element excision recombinase XisF [Nostoc sp. FACHB-110]|uniref:fdxN element excision recombinase XisF n=1 Tax=Nostoc sp. FACHB-110 TaxID=2692834 RepID=UPI0016869F69|nr:fdxN element excision recombinase XisF [Nostoc sp. FACHB-110]MBD2438771.1 recombinase family protein [Nostoc sp. FACHB-110]